jgi:hypothetical protein
VAVVSDLTAPLYGVPAPPAKTFARAALPPDARAGVLTSAGLMAKLALERETDPVKRGRFVREQLLCQPLPPPPPDVPPPPDSKGTFTQRERLAIHSKDPACAVCHVLMDDLGLAFETYDGIGRRRTIEFGKPIEVAGAITRTSASDAPFTDAIDLARKLARSPDVAACFAGRLAEHAEGRALPDACMPGDLPARWLAEGGNLVDLAVAVTTADHFFFRAP